MALKVSIYDNSKQEESSHLMPTSLDNIKSVRRVFIALSVKYPLCFLLCHNQGLHKLNNCGIAYLKNTLSVSWARFQNHICLSSPPQMSSYQMSSLCRFTSRRQAE